MVRQRPWFSNTSYIVQMRKKQITLYLFTTTQQNTMKSFTLFIALCVAFTAHAQTQKGNSFVSGGVAFNHRVLTFKDPQFRTFAPQFNLEYGHFVRDNVALKVQTGASWEIIRSSQNEYKENRVFWNARVLGSYYFGSNQWRGFVGGGLGTSLQNTRGNSSTVFASRSARNNFYPVFEVGGIYFVNRHLALQVSTQSIAMPFELGSFSAGLVYWLKPQKFVIDNTNVPNTLAKGNWVIGGSFGGENNSNDATNRGVKIIDQKNSTFQVRASIGKFVRDRTVVGLELNYLSSKTKLTLSDSKNVNYGVGVFLKRYWSPNHLTPFSSYELKFQRNTNGETAFSNQYEANVNLGLAYLISPRFILEANLFRLNQTYLVAVNNDFTEYGANIRGALTSGFTLQYVLK